MAIFKECYVCNGKSLLDLQHGKFSIKKCNMCGFQYVLNHREHIGKNYFEGYSDRRENQKNQVLNELRIKQYKLDVEFLSEYMSDNSRVLDVGCGSGIFTSEVCQRYHPKYILGIDIDKLAIQSAISKYPKNIDFKSTSFLEIEKNSKFDLIVFRGTFQYLDQTLGESVQHMKNILTPQGKIVLFSLPSTDSFVYYLLKEKWALFHPEMSLMFNEKSIRYLFNLHSFRIDRLDYPYIGSAYENVMRDYDHLMKIISGNSDESTPFWGGEMRVVISK